MMKKALHYLPLAIFAALLPVMILRDFTPSNELRYLSIADEAIEQGNVFAFTNHGEPYADKPPLYLWIVMLGRLLCGGHAMWFLSLFSFVPAVVIMMIMNRWVREVTDDEMRFTASMMLMSCGLFLGLAVVLRMDMLMCMFITLALWLFWRMYTGKGGRRERILFPIAVFMALFSKGPVGVLVPLVSTIAFLVVRGKWRDIGRYWGWTTWGILLAGCAAWFGAVWIEGGSEYLNNLLFHQTVDRAVDAFHHKEPFWYYLVSVWYSLALWSPLFCVVYVTAAARREKLTELETLFVTVIVTTVAMLSAFSSKLAVYLAPTFPFFVYLAAMLMSRMKTNGFMRGAVAFVAAVYIVVLPVIAVPAFGIEGAFVGNAWCIVAASVMLVAGIVALVFIGRPNLNVSICTLAGGLFVALFFGGLALHSLNAEIGYGELCRTAREVAAEKGLDGYYVWKVSRPENMDVYLGEDVRELSAEEVLEGRSRGGVLMLSERWLRRNDDIRRFVENNGRITVGNNMIVVLQDGE